MKVAALQLTSQDSLAANLAATEKHLVESAAAGAELVVLPEGFSFLGPEADKAPLAEDLQGDGPVLRLMRRLAKEHGVFLVAGGIIERSSDPRRPYNTSTVFNPEGQLLGSYRKMHLFDVELDDGTCIRESLATTPGETPVVVQAADWVVGLTICYDLRFPEIFAWQRAQGAELLTVPSAFTKTTGQAHWHALLRGRAIETQCWLIAAAQEGTHPKGRETFGHAMIIDPWGHIVAEKTSPGPGFVLADIDHETVDRVRRQIPVHLHRRTL